ncbi:hypothetical protein [Streptomyces sp.]|uniref:hypothetical protein n=2 Tax=Streptomyces sp. TaxID=1931 RepID=UPI002811C657|nr:hypothetical protein [Streptomyces sp.]
MSMEKPAPPPAPAPEGCLTAVVRIPVRIVVLVLVVPVRMVWDVLAAGGRFVGRSVLRPLGRGLAAAGVWLGRALFVWPWVALWRYVLGPVLRYGIAVPSAWLYRAVLTPLGHGLVRLAEVLVRAPAAWLYHAVLTPLGQGLAWFFSRLGRGLALGGGWLLRALFVWPWVGLWRYVLVPLVRYGIVLPLSWLWRYAVVPAARYGIALPLGLLWRYAVVLPFGRLGRRVLLPVAREIGAAFVVGWRVAGFVSRAVGRALALLARTLVGRPAAWFYRSVCTPVGHWVRDSLWTPARKAAAEAGRAVRGTLAAARATVRQARADAWRALVGGTRVPEAGEPEVAKARTLGSTRNVPGAVPAPEISPQTRG